MGPLTRLVCGSLALFLCGCSNQGRGHMMGAPDASVPMIPGESCGNHLDDNGNNLVDEGGFCQEGATGMCWPGPPGRRNIGACRDGVQKCEAFGEFIGWGP